MDISKKYYRSPHEWADALPAKKADRRIWRMMAIVRRFVFCSIFSHLLLRYIHIPNMSEIRL